MRSPKLAPAHAGDWYRYYAGYAVGFVEDALSALELEAASTVLDPWNGSGTTTSVAKSRGFRARGFDANPALVVIARARLVGPEVVESIGPLTEDLIEHARTSDLPLSTDDPFTAWFEAPSARTLRRLELSIRRVLIDPTSVDDPHRRAPLRSISGLAALFYMGVFECVRRQLRPFFTSNPTWVKVAGERNRIRITAPQLYGSFREVMERLEGRVHLNVAARVAVRCDLGNSTALPLRDDSVDCVVASPPYCTRIDYVMATRPELAVLGFQAVDLQALRDSMLGTPTVASTTPEISAEWGPSANGLVADVQSHESYASPTYYRKYFVQYLDGLFRSLRELRRVLRPGGPAILVVQDSYYKNVHVDLPHIVLEMSEQLGWKSSAAEEFPIARTKASVHPGTRKWRRRFSAKEVAVTLS